LIISKILSKLRWPFFLAYAVFLYAAFTLPVDQIPDTLYQINDTFLHFLSFLIFSLLAYQAFSHSASRVFSAYAENKSAVLSLSYGAFLELIQKTIPGRIATLNDWAADALGVLTASLLFLFQKKKL
jgi:VanZ family protein